MVRYWSIGNKRRGWNGMQTIKNLSLLTQLRYMKMKELLDKGMLQDDAATKEVQA